MDSPKHFRVWVNLSWLKASTSCTADWRRRGLGKMARLTQVPPTLGHWASLPPEPGVIGKRQDVSARTGTARRWEGNALGKQLASRGSCHHCPPSHSHFHSPEKPASSCGTGSHPALSRCWANHLHLSPALLPVTHRITDRTLPLPFLRARATASFLGPDMGVSSAFSSVPLHCSSLWGGVLLAKLYQNAWASQVVQRVKNLPNRAGDTRNGFDPCVGKIPWKDNGTPLQYSCLENPMESGGLQSMGSQSQKWISGWTTATKEHKHPTLRPQDLCSFFSLASY